MFEMYEPIGDCSMCSKRSEVVYIKESIWGSIKIRMFCKQHAKEHLIIKSTH